MFQTTIIIDLCRFIQSGLICSMTFEEQIGLSNVNHKIIYKLVLYLICNDWKQILRPDAPPKIFLKTFCYKNQTFYIAAKFTSSFCLVTLNTTKPFKLYIYIYIYIHRVIMSKYIPFKNISTTVFFNLFSLTQ